MNKQKHINQCSKCRRCRVGENWWYRGEHCEEYVSEPLVVGIAIASVAGFLMVAAGIIFFLARSLREQYDGEDTEDPLRSEPVQCLCDAQNRFCRFYKRSKSNQNFPFSRRGESVPTLERATKFNPMFESDPVTAQYYRRYDDNMPQYPHRMDPEVTLYSSSLSADGSKELGSDEIQHIYQNTSLSREVLKLSVVTINIYSLFSLVFVDQTQRMEHRTGYEQVSVISIEVCFNTICYLSVTKIICLINAPNLCYIRQHVLFYVWKR